MPEEVKVLKQTMNKILEMQNSNVNSICFDCFFKENIRIFIRAGSHQSPEFVLGLELDFFFCLQLCICCLFFFGFHFPSYYLTTHFIQICFLLVKSSTSYNCYYVMLIHCNFKLKEKSFQKLFYILFDSLKRKRAVLDKQVRYMFPKKS